MGGKTKIGGTHVISSSLFLQLLFFFFFFFFVVFSLYISNLPLYYQQFDLQIIPTYTNIWIGIQHLIGPVHLINFATYFSLIFLFFSLVFLSCCCSSFWSMYTALRKLIVFWICNTIHFNALINE